MILGNGSMEAQQNRITTPISLLSLTIIGSLAQFRISEIASCELLMVLSNFNGVGVGFGFGVGCGFGVGWGFGGIPLSILGLGAGGGCGVGVGLGWGFGSAFGSHYRSSRLTFNGVEFDKKGKGGSSTENNDKNKKSIVTTDSNSTRQDKLL
ncbi:hypothetical protein LINGRAHAP2_LOCUS10317 [Linum grandiflorum]